MLLATNEWTAREVASTDDETTAELFVSGEFPIPESNQIPRLLELDDAQQSARVLNLSLILEPVAIEKQGKIKIDQARFRKEVPRGAYKKIRIEYLGQPLVTLDVANS